MSYSAAEGRGELLAATAEAAEAIGVALAALTAAYELIDEDTADRLEAELFGPVQAAYGRAKRAHAGFAARHGLPAHAFGVATPGAPSTGAHGYVEQAVEAAEHADDILSELQDSLLPVEVGDAELRAGLSDVRRQLDGLPGRARRFVSVLGR
jgi:hypothetical protein